MTVTFDELAMMVAVSLVVSFFLILAVAMFIYTD